MLSLYFRAVSAVAFGIILYAHYVNRLTGDSDPSPGNFKSIELKRVPALATCKTMELLSPSEFAMENWICRTEEAYIEQFLGGPPKFRYLLMELKRILFTNAKPEGHRKVVCYFFWPRSAKGFLKLLDFIIYLDSKIPPEKRFQHIDDFNNNNSGPMVLLTNYQIQLQGQDLHPKCCTVFLVEPGFNASTEIQAYARVYRLGQTQPVDVYRLFTSDTYQDNHAINMLMKEGPILAALGAVERYSGQAKDLAMKVFGMERDRLKHERDEAAVVKYRHVGRRGEYLA